VSLAIGEPDFDTPDVIVAAAVEALRSGETHYVDQNGLPELRTAVAGHLTALAGTAYRPDQVAVTHGATAALAASVLAMVDPGDRVVIPEPCYSLYGDLVHLAGGVPIFVPARDDLHWDLDALRVALRDARLVIYSNPCNPTGVVHGAAELAALGELLAGTGTLVIADEAYHAIVYDRDTFTSSLSVRSLRDRTVYVQTLSKTYAMTGWRIGYVAGPAEVIAAASRIHRTFNGSLNAAVQRAGLTALAHGPALAAPMLEEYRKRRAVFFERLTEIPELTARMPDGTFYAFARYRLPVSSTEFADRLRRAGVQVRAGIEYGRSGEGHIRFSFASDIATIHQAMDRVTSCLATWS
jgi:aspartate aminotransferase